MGPVPGYPYDDVGLQNGLSGAELKQTLADVNEPVGLSNELNRVILKQTLADMNEPVGLQNCLVSVTVDPEPIFVTVSNNATDKISSISGTEGMAIPGVDYTYAIKYVDGYEYAAGDINVNCGTLSDDGATLTVNMSGDTDIIFN